MRRIRRDQEHEEFIEGLSSGDGAIFKDFWSVLLFAAMLGFRANRRIPLEKYDSGKAMPDSYFANSLAWPGILYLLGLVETNQTAILGSNETDEDSLVGIFEEYANGGLHLMRERFMSGNDSLTGLIDLVNDFGENPNVSTPDLSITI